MQGTNEQLTPGAFFALGLRRQEPNEHRLAQDNASQRLQREQPLLEGEAVVGFCETAEVSMDSRSCRPRLVRGLAKPEACAFEVGIEDRNASYVPHTLETITECILKLL